MEEIAKQITISISHAAEIVAAIIIGAALIEVVISYTAKQWTKQGMKKTIPGPADRSPQRLRVKFGGAVAIALELMLGADVLATAVAPNWNDIGQLAAIAVIRTSLNYFLGKELREIRIMNNE